MIETLIEQVNTDKTDLSFFIKPASFVSISVVSVSIGSLLKEMVVKIMG